ncbi:hypothetical protein [Candidatus Anaplasma sp. TIGMIC]|uniref:hypothetical protein n=1 Tax=Candidatus Anaplasma sp. TIGMIC TaxID=3020713 RepID=UPI0023301CEC|nr:hypothetical protein [Candidatus Anaplasma sp. TIGMIC]MDB1135678.1 hypothetical protein [Candidatus Anaplasma sp. TIGMIC]
MLSNVLMSILTLSDILRLGMPNIVSCVAKISNYVHKADINANNVDLALIFERPL